MSEKPDERDIMSCMRYAKQLIRGRGGNSRDFERAVYYFDIAAQAGELDDVLAGQMLLARSWLQQGHEWSDELF